MRIVLLGSGAGEGFPSWNDGSENADRARRGDPFALPRLASAIAISVDGERYSILDAPLHLPTTLGRSPKFAPKSGTRASPIDSIVVTTGTPTGHGGLLGFGSAPSFRVASSAKLRESLLDHDASLRALEPFWHGFKWDRPFPLDREGVLEARLFPLKGPPADHLRELAPQSGNARCGVRVLDQESGTRLVWAPRISKFDSGALAELREADIRFVDGTCYSESEVGSLRPGARALTELGHTPIDGPDGSLTWLAGMRGISVYVHVAGSNPAGISKSAECERIRAAGVEVASDEQEWTL